MRHLEEFKKCKDLIDEYGEGNAHLAWVMALYLDRNDIQSLASESITDGKGDKKIDFIYLGDGRIIIAQGYYSQQMKETAPANKASDLNTALAWLHSGDIEDVPVQLKQPILDCRKAIKDDLVNSIEVIYAHNVSESQAVQKELETLVGMAGAAFKENNIEVSGYELGIEKIESLFTTKNSQIAVSDDIEIPCGETISQNGEGWKAVQFSANGSWLRALYDKYDTDLYSANYRGFLGIKRQKINVKIKATAESKPKNFWAFNNGITMLTNKVKSVEKDKILIQGVSIINGAQTTGSLFSIEQHKEDVLSKVQVMCRVIECSDVKLIPDIIRYNNTQNAITSWDMYSNSSEQKRIQEEFAKIDKKYSLKKGFENNESELGISSVAQSCLALRGDFRDANRGKNYIFENNYTYNYVFEKKTAKHILFAYTLGRAIEKKKSILKIKNNSEGLNANEKKQHNYFNSLSFKHYLMSIIGYCMDEITSKPVELDSIYFKKECSQKSIEELIQFWLPIIDLVLTSLTTVMKEVEISSVISTKEKFLEIAGQTKAMIAMFKTANSEPFDNFAAQVVVK